MTIIFRERPQVQPVQPWLVLLLSLMILAITSYMAIIDEPMRMQMIRKWGFLPIEFQPLLGAEGWQSRDWRNLLVIMFSPATALLLHASWLHLLGNIAYLWAFGLSVERYTGHVTLALVFFLVGALANILLIWLLPDLTKPVIGSSGGISGLIGCYLVLFPMHRMGLYLPLGLYMKFAHLPSLFVIGSWFVLQVIYSLQGPLSGNIVWRVHLTGFFAGMLCGLLLRLFRPNLRSA
ncbi:MAG: rhomboid family intramembrane serine protease [Gammaproteobacteria bacterium]|jgi:membrane associated rhomboid family serine protease|nr:rhomboid family intramembrane serine protease [Gammaproteobacteria bacterium]